MDPHCGNSLQYLEELNFEWRCTILVSLGLGLPEIWAHTWALPKISVYRAIPSVAFVMSFFGRSPLYEREGIPLPTKGFREALQKNDICLALYCCAWDHCTSVIFVRVRRKVPRALPGTHKIAETWTH